MFPIIHSLYKIPIETVIARSLAPFGPYTLRSSAKPGWAKPPAAERLQDFGKAALGAAPDLLRPYGTTWQSPGDLMA